MTPDDPRHGTEAGHMTHRRDAEPSCDRCLHARMVAAKRRRLYGTTKVPALGAQRRVRALQALGHSRKVIANRIGYTNNGAMSYLMQAETMQAETAAKIAAVYDELCMVVPTGVGPKRARTWAKKFGFVPPLAWDDIDNDPEPSNPDAPNYDTDYDESMVLRVLNGGPRPRRMTHAEGTEVVRRLLASGRTTHEIKHVWGMKPERYVRIGDVA
jgi:hypothetical protein